jgi:hypothetical protein
MVSAGDSNVPNDSGGEDPRHGLPQGVAKPYRFLYTLLVIIAPASIMLNVVLLVLNWGLADASKIAFGIFITCLCISIIPFIAFAVRWRRITGHIHMRTVMNAYSWRKVGWIDRIVTIVLFATAFIAFAFFAAHGHPPHE